MIHHRVTAAIVWSAAVLCAETPAGRWDAEVRMGALRVPFTLYFEGHGAKFSAQLAAGSARVPVRSASFDGKNLRADFGPSGGRLEAVLSEGSLKGTFGSDALGKHPFKAAAYCTCSFAGEGGPDITGNWESKDSGLRIALRREGEDTLATVTRDGRSTGPFTGRFNGGFFELSFFDGREGALLEVEPRKDGALDLALLTPGATPQKSRAVRAK